MIASLCEIRLGDVLVKLMEMADHSVDCVVTSPPYWGQRDYGIEGQLGLEETLEDHIAIMVRIFAEIRRVLKPHGTLWLNYGDCYASEPNGNLGRTLDNRAFTDKPFSTIGGQRKAKDLCLIPEHLIIALQASGWWVKSRITWGKSNPMPDSKGHYRPAVAHELIYLLAPADNQINCYRDRVTGDVAFFDTPPTDRAPCITNPQKTQPRWVGMGTYYNGRDVRVYNHNKTKGGPKKSKPRKISAEKVGRYEYHQGLDRLDQISKQEQQANGRMLRTWEHAPDQLDDIDLTGEFEPPRDDIWPMACVGFKDAHFATFPLELATRCIEAGCVPGGVVLDPFGGAGTTGIAACQMNRPSILIEINPTYADMARQRIDRHFMGKTELTYAKAAEQGADNRDLPLIGLMVENP